MILITGVLVVGVETPNPSRNTLKRYCNFGINKPCVFEDWLLAKGTVNFESVDIAILFFLLIVFTMLYSIILVVPF